MEALRRQKGVALRNFHLIGHSLGAHVAGHAGARLDGRLGRISGMLDVCLLLLLCFSIRLQPVEDSYGLALRALGRSVAAREGADEGLLGLKDTNTP
jgi:pimeloyl-ACP methyl ester carboxylesterase